MGSILFKLFFLGIFLAISYYILYLQTEKYESKSTVMVKDLSQAQSVSPLGALLSVGNSASMQDSKLLEVYIKSEEMYELIDNEFNLTLYYTSSAVDKWNRLSRESDLPMFEANMANLLLKYHDDLSIVYDEPSSTLSIGFAHANPKIAQQIVKKIIIHAGKTLNVFEKKSSEIVLKFLKKQEKEKYNLFLSSVKDLLAYQNKNKTFNPQIDIESKSSILAGLESQLIQKEVEYNSKLQYMNPKAPEMILFFSNINHIKRSIKKVKNKISGSKGKKELNVNLSDFELLKSKVDFNKEIYGQILLRLEETTVLVRQNTKNLIVISKASLADAYSYPNKTKDTFSVFIIILFLYGVLSMIFQIIKDHKD
ncbi:MAG: Capsular polysaccharide export system inner membrane protein KpsE [uncultured Sulfurovum sp.]|uniref:Capsular polysaccharide export system inner membrane protein KpsE n=1 Tax=uncultured Sulfurovum sp. TaxID=269237 RepID=A0A6S6U9C9_9BACT|nr:MAG: Capsular polysaccharide export system inner membrane protein KpsE [uncultured Sulfurovum sp.]